METYCGKNCADCASKEALNCPGCKTGPGRLYGGDCELAKCARSKGHSNCAGCSFRGNCGTLRGCHHIPEYRRRKLEAEELRKATLARRAPILGKWIWLIFWLIIPTTMASLMSNDTLAQIVPGLYLSGQILNILCSVAYGLILLKLGEEEDRYRTAGICTLIAGGINAVIAAVSGMPEASVWVIVLAIPAEVLSLVSVYNEFQGHSAVLTGVNNELSEKWTVLWKWFIGLFLGMFGCIFVALLIPILGASALLVVVIGSLVVSILKLVYLYRTAQVFRGYSPER